MQNFDYFSTATLVTSREGNLPHSYPTVTFLLFSLRNSSATAGRFIADNIFVVAKKLSGRSVILKIVEEFVAVLYCCNHSVAHIWNARVSCDQNNKGPRCCCCETASRSLTIFSPLQVGPGDEVGPLLSKDD